MNIQATDWDKFRIFYFVSKAPSITKAAETLRLSQPALSRAIASLENRLQIRLFERGARGIMLTEEGKRLAETVDNVFNEFSRYQEMRSSKQKEVQGLLKVILPRTLPVLQLSRMTPDFLRTYPQIKLALLGCEKERDFTPFEADAAIATFNEHAQDMEQIYLTTCLMGLYASPGYLQKYGMPQKVSDLDAYHLIAFGDPSMPLSCPFNKVLEWSAKQGKAPVADLYVSSIEEMKWAAEANLGIVTLSEEYVAGDSSLVKVLPEELSLSVDLYYIFRSYHKESKKITTYGTFLSNKFKALHSNSLPSPCFGKEVKVGVRQPNGSANGLSSFQA